jgi:hypothetical protein
MKAKEYQQKYFAIEVAISLWSDHLDPLDKVSQYPLVPKPYSSTKISAGLVSSGDLGRIHCMCCTLDIQWPQKFMC